MPYTIVCSVQSMRTTTLPETFHIFFIHLKWIMAVILHSVNDNVNNNKMYFIIFCGQINALERIIWNESWSNISRQCTIRSKDVRMNPNLLEHTCLAIMHKWHLVIVLFVVWTRTHLSTLTPSQSWPTAIQTKGSFWNTTSLLFFAKSKSTRVILII